MPGHGSKVKIEPQWLARLILGKDMWPDHQKQIREWAKLRQPELAIVQASFDDLHQEISPERVTLTLYIPHYSDHSKKKSFPTDTGKPFIFQSLLVGAVGIEPTTFGLKGRCSTTELRP